MTDADRLRLDRAWTRYRSAPRKQRAWAARNPGNVAIREELVATVRSLAREQIDGDGDLLDVGCGTGWWLRELAASGTAIERLHGVDLLARRADAARAAVPGADVRAADARHLPYEDASFALVTHFATLSTLPDGAAVRAAVGESMRVLRPGGLLLVYDPRIVTPLNRLTRLVRSRDVAAAAGSAADACVALTVLPPLARRLGPRTARAYPILRRVPLLLTHRVLLFRR